VAVLALLRKLPLVLVGVASAAIGPEAQVRVRVKETLIRPNVFRRDMALRVAPDAFERSVLPLQNVPGLIVVEVLLVESDKREAPAVMLVVAPGAWLSGQLPVEPPPRRHARTELRMARKAIVVRNFLPESVAFRAVPHPFQGGVGSGQITGRDLRRRRRAPCQEESGRHDCVRDGTPQNIHV
jgi:hypothetical protein